MPRQKNRRSSMSRGHTIPKRHGSRKIEAAATKYRLFSITPPLTEMERPPSARNAQAEGVPGKRKSRRASRAAEIRRTFFSIYPILCAEFGRKTVFDHAARIPGREGSKERREARRSFLRREVRQGRALKRCGSVLSPLPCIKKRNAPLLRSVPFFFFCFFSALRARLLHPLTARAPFLSLGRRGGRFLPFGRRDESFSSFRTAWRAFFLPFGRLGRRFFFLTAAF